MTIYIKFDGIDGNVSSKGHEKWSAVDAFSFNCKRYITTHVGSTQDRESGIPRISEVDIIKPVDNTSAHLFSNFCKGKSISKVTIDVCHTDGQLQAHSTYILHDVLVSQYEDSTVADEGLGMEYVTLNFAKIEKKQIPHDAKGGAGSPIISSYDLTTAQAG